MVPVLLSSSSSIHRKRLLNDSLVVVRYFMWLSFLLSMIVLCYYQYQMTIHDLSNVAPFRTRAASTLSSPSSRSSQQQNSRRQRDGTTTFDAKQSNTDLAKNCRFYMAESAIPNGGIALFTAFDLAMGEEAQPMPDVCIYVADTPKIRTAFRTHSWSDAKFIGQFEGGNPRGACEGIGTLVNHMPALEATSTLKSMHHHTNGGLHRYHDPGAGAITQYYGITSKTQRDVSAGSELTITYGDWKGDPKHEHIIPARSVEWLHENGMCIDNIEIKNATDPSMGRGAFARYDLKSGSLVAPAPLQVFPNRSAFAEQTPEALFVNYCFQPEGSNILLFPYGPGVNLINHGSTKKANIKVEWSSHYLSHTQWLSLPKEQFWQMQYPGSILIDYIALRDIQAGEELLLDYGEDWEEAWDVHVENWQPMIDIENYTYVEEIDRTQPFRTLEEQQNEPYSQNLHSVCMTKNWDRERYSVMKWKKPIYDFPRNLVYCSILERSMNNRTKEFEYTVALNFHSQNPESMELNRYVDTHVPHWAISFVDKPYMSDLHLPNSFRHPIVLPNHMAKSVWF
jgi:hypothetical protein